MEIVSNFNLNLRLVEFRAKSFISLKWKVVWIIIYQWKSEKVHFGNSKKESYSK